MSTKAFLLCVLAALVAGYLLGGFSASTRADRDIHNLKNSLERRNYELKKLKADGVRLERLARTAHDTVTIEKLRYEKIQPRSYSYPELDSLFRSRYEK